MSPAKSRAAVTLGRKGGKRTTPAQTAARQANGAKGGAPRLTVDTTGRISIGDEATGYGVRQTATGTEVIALDRIGLPTLPPITLPHTRYSLAHPRPISGVPGFEAFNRDFRAALKALK